MGNRSIFDEPVEGEYASLLTEMDENCKRSTTNRLGAIVPRVAIAGIVLVVFAIVAFVLANWWILAGGACVAVLVFASAHTVLEWERVVVLRFGKFQRISGPGLVFLIPFFESSAATVDLRMRSTAFKAEHVLTADLVPVDVDAVLFWLVHDARQASTEVRNFERLVFWMAQTTLRDVMGDIEIAQMSTRRVQMDKEIAEILERKTRDLGISVISVEIRDIEVPEELQDALSAEAKARQEYNARVILAEVEQDVADIFVEATRTYKQEEGSLQLRSMNILSESVIETGGLVVIPSDLAHTFENAGKLTRKHDES